LTHLNIPELTSVSVKLSLNIVALCPWCAALPIYCNVLFVKFWRVALDDVTIVALNWLVLLKTKKLYFSVGF